MLSSGGAWRRLYRAPLSKALLLVPSILACLLTLAFPQLHSVFTYSLQAVRQEGQVWRLVCGRLLCLDLKDTFCSSLLIYNLSIFERRYGSRKYASFLFGTWALSAFIDVLLIEALDHLFSLKVQTLPSGFLSPIFALFVPFYCSIPRVQITQVLGHVAITNKSLVYVVGLQLLSSSPLMWLITLSGLISGLLYHNNTMKIQHVLRVPTWVARACNRLLQPLFSGTGPAPEAVLGMGATLDIQRQQRMDLLDQQIQFVHMRRNQQQQVSLINWNRFFPSLRRRGQNFNQTNPNQLDPQSSASVSEEQVARLMEMGFSRPDALEALRASNNDINMATNFLLQH